MWLLNYEDFKIFTLSPAYSLICMTVANKNNSAHLRAMGYLGTKYSMTCILVYRLLRYRVYKLGVTHTHSCVFAIYLPRTANCLLFCIKLLTLTLTITSPIVCRPRTSCSHCIVDRGPGMLLFRSSIAYENQFTYTHTYTHTHARQQDRIGSWCSSEQKRLKNSPFLPLLQ